MIKKLIFLAVFLLVNAPAFAQLVYTDWVCRYGDTAHYFDSPYDMVVDHFGNVYVTGESSNNHQSTDFLTIKYRPDGTTAWIKRQVWSTTGNEESRAIAIDIVGNVYVTGMYGTCKYSPDDGDSLWAMGFQGPAEAYDIAVDVFGNAYVTGGSPGMGSGSDLITMKYNSLDHDTTWVKRYNGTGSGFDCAYAMALDDSGYVYVIGTSMVAGTSLDYITIKYNPTYLDTVWTRRYSGTGNIDDQARGIAVDDSGYIYVTGLSGSDFVTIKYRPNGDSAWVKKYEGPITLDPPILSKPLTVDGSGNVYITGTKNNGYITIKYSSNGDNVWTRTYGNSAQSIAITADRSGNSYVTGYINSDYVTIKYKSNGDTAWVRTYDYVHLIEIPCAIAVDDFRNVYVTGRSAAAALQYPELGYDYDYATIKYYNSLCGDVNCDSSVSVSDLVYLSNYLFKGGPPPCDTVTAGDINCSSGTVNVTDLLYLSSYLFQGGPPPCDTNRDGVEECRRP